MVPDKNAANLSSFPILLVLLIKELAQHEMLASGLKFMPFVPDKL
jgi:hypothetical protein